MFKMKKISVLFRPQSIKYSIIKGFDQRLWSAGKIKPYKCSDIFFLYVLTLKSYRYLKISILFLCLTGRAGPAAINSQQCSGHKSRSFAGQERNATGYLLCIDSTNGMCHLRLLHMLLPWLISREIQCCRGTNTGTGPGNQYYFLFEFHICL